MAKTVSNARILRKSNMMYKMKKNSHLVISAISTLKHPHCLYRKERYAILEGFPFFKVNFF